MALDRLTKVDGGGISTTSDYRVGIITASKFVGPIEGTITSADATFTGNVSIGGTLTYEDVTNIDSVGLITARSGIDCNGDIDVDGHTNLDNVSVAGVTTFTDDVYFDGATAGRDIVFDRSENQLEFARHSKAYFGGSFPLTIYNNINSYISQNPNAALFIESKDVQIYGSGNGYNNAIFIARNGIVELGYEPSGGSLSTQLKTSAKGITVGTGVTIETNGNSNFVGVSSLGTGDTGAVYLYNPDADALSGTTNDIYGWKAKTYTGGLQVNSTLYLSRGGTNGLSLAYNNATGGYINQSVGFLNITCPGGLPIYYNAYQHQFRSPPGKDFLIINNSNDQAVHLYQNDVLRFSTASSGVNVVGTTTTTQLAVTGVSTFTGNIDANGDLDVDGHTELDNANVSGVVTFTGTSGNAIRLLDNRTIQFGSEAASRTSMYYDSSASRTKIRNFNDTLEIGYRTVELHYVNQARLTIAGSNTFSADANTTFMGDSYHASWVPSQNKLQINDNAKLAFGSQADATILHNNANLLISNTTGIIDVTGNVELNNDLDVDGHTNLDNVSVSGVTTTSKLVIDSTTPMIDFAESDGNPDYRIYTEGGSFVIRDQSNVQERFKITSAGNALFGTGVSQTNRQLVVGSNAEANLAIETHNTSASETANIRFYRSRGTAASPTTLIDNDVISQLLFYGHDGTDYANAAATIRVECDGNVAGNQMPGSISFNTNSGTTSTTEKLRIRSTGQVGIGTVLPVEKLEVNGAINAGGDNSPVFNIRNETGSHVRAFKHYFDRGKAQITGYTANHTLVNITIDESFHQAGFEVTYFTRLQAVSDTHVRPNKIIFGVNRFNSASTVNVTKTVVEQHSDAASHCDVNIVSVSGTNYKIELQFSTQPNVSSAAGGWVEGACVLGARFVSVDYYHGIRT